MDRSRYIRSYSFRMFSIKKESIKFIKI